MMIRLTTRDASILARMVQYDNLSRQQQLQILSDASTEAQHIGRVLLGIDQPNSGEVRETADAIRNWVAKNRANSHSSNRRQRAAHGAYRYV